MSFYMLVSLSRIASRRELAVISKYSKQKKPGRGLLMESLPLIAKCKNHSTALLWIGKKEC